MKTVIRGIGAYVPEKRVTNDELSATLDTSDEWIRSHTGIGARHIAADDQGTSDLAKIAAERAMASAGVSPDDIDGVIVATATPDYAGFPSTACVLQEKLGLINAGAMDLAAGCTGFVYALETAKSMICGGTWRNVLIVGAEVLTRITDWSDRSTCVLFGDGAGSIVISADESDENRGVQHSILKADGSGAEYLQIPGGGCRTKDAFQRSGDSSGYLAMDGRAVYNFAVRVNTEIITDLLEHNSLTIDDIAYIVPHQANVRIIQAAASRLKLPIEKFYLNMERYANTSAASIPLAIDEMNRKGLLKPGDKLLTVGFGAGLTYGGNYLIW